MVYFGDVKHTCERGDMHGLPKQPLNEVIL